jgi:hypothetical protein
VEIQEIDDERLTMTRKVIGPFLTGTSVRTEAIAHAAQAASGRD